MLKQKKALKICIGFFIFGSVFNFSNLNKFRFSNNIVKAMESDEELINMEVNDNDEDNSAVSNLNYVLELDDATPWDRRLIGDFGWSKMLRIYELLYSFRLEYDMCFERIESYKRCCKRYFTRKEMKACGIRSLLFCFLNKAVQFTLYLGGDTNYEESCNKAVRDIIIECSKDDNSNLPFCSHKFVESGNSLINSQDAKCSWRDCWLEYSSIRPILLKKKENEFTYEDICKAGAVVKRMCNLIDTISKVKVYLKTISDNIGKYLTAKDLYLHKKRNLFEDFCEYSNTFLEVYSRALEVLVTCICTKCKLDRSREFTDTLLLYFYEYFAEVSKWAKEEFENIDNDKCGYFGCLTECFKNLIRCAENWFK